MATLGRAFIEIVADTSKFGASIRRGLKQSLASTLDKEVQAAGTKAGATFSNSFNTELSKGVKKSGKTVGESVSKGMKDGEGKAKETATDIARRIGFEFDKGGELAGLKFVDKVSRETKRLGLVMEKAGHDAQGKFIVGFNPQTGVRTAFRDVEKAASQAGKRVGTAFRRDANKSFKDIRGDIADLGKRFGLLGRIGGRALSNVTKELNAIARGGASFATITAAALSALPAVLSLSASLADLAGLLAVAPAAATSFAIAISGLVLSLKGFSAVIKATSDKQLEKALDGMGTSARKLALQLRALKPAFNTVRQAAQESFVKALGPIDSIKKLLPTLRSGFARIGQVLGGAGKQLLAFATSKETLSTLKTLFDVTGGAVKSLVVALGPLLKGLRSLADIGAPFIKQFGDGLGVVITKFGKFLDASAKSGKATEWIHTALGVLSQLGDIATNVAGIFNSFLTAGQAQGGGFLSTLQKVTAQLDTFFKSAEGSKALDSFFAGLAQIGTAIAPLFGTVATGIGKIAPLIAGVITTIAPALDIFLGSLGDALVKLGPGLDALSGSIADVLVALAPALIPVAEAISAIAVAIAPLITGLGTELAGELAALATALIPLATVFGTLFKAAVPVMQLIGKALLDAAIQLLPIVLQLADAFGRAFKPVIEAVVKALKPLLPVIGQLVEQFVKELKPQMPTLIQAFFALAQALIPLIDEFGKQLLEAMKQIVPLIPGLAVAMVQLVVAFSQLVVAITPLLPMLVPLIQTLLPFAVPIIENLSRSLQFAADVITVVTAAFKLFMASLRFTISVVSGFKDRLVATFLQLKTAVQTAWKFITDKVKDIGDAILGIPARLAGVGLAIGAAISSGIQGALDGVKGIINGLIRAFNRLPGPDIAELANGAVVMARRTVVVGEAGPEVVIPLTRPRRAAELTEQSGLAAILARRGFGTAGPQITINAPITVVAASADPNLVAVKVAARLARLAVI